MDNAGVLNSWKEISNYIGRGVRTVQRWERDFGLPVRRPAGHMKSAVVALRRDIDEWLVSRRMREVAKQQKPRIRVLDHSRIERFAANVELLQKNLEVLRLEHERFMAARRSLPVTAAPVRPANTDTAA
jgi:hypothetical protein